MRKFCLLAVMFFVQTTLHGTCPSPIPPLPTLDVPAIPPGTAPPPSSCPPSPAPATVANYLPFVFVNNSGVAANQVYISVLVNSTTQYLSFSTVGGHKVGAATNFTPSTYLSNTLYTHPLSFFENIGGNSYVFYVPNTGNTGIANSNPLVSSRIVVSLHQPLTYFIDSNGILGITSDVLATNDNYYVLQDKIEFDIGSNSLNNLNLNLTGVDYFGLPFLIQTNYQYFFGSSYTPYCAVTGWPSAVTLANVFSGYNNALTSLASPFSTYYSGLVATYTNPPGSSSPGNSILRIFAPATAIGSTQKQTNPTPVSFPGNYFLNTALNPSGPQGCTWFSGVWSGTTQNGSQAFYQQTPTNYLVLDATAVGGSSTAKGSLQSDGGFYFVIDGGGDAGKVITFPQPTSSVAFFTGAVADYQPPIVTNASAATVKQVLKAFSAPVLAGIIPINCKKGNGIVISDTWIQSQSANYFQNNSALDSELGGCSCLSNSPWYDFYSRTLLTLGSPNLFYTSAYSDFLGTNGSIVVTSLNTANANATVQININDSTTGVIAPDPYSDTTNYSITVGIPSTATVLYGTSAGGPFGAIPAMSLGNNFFLQVTYTTGAYAGTPYVTQIAPSIQVFHPILPVGGVITTNGTTTNVSIGGP